MSLFLVFVAMCLYVGLQIFFLKALENLKIIKKSSSGLLTVTKIFDILSIVVAFAYWLTLFIWAVKNTNAKVLELFEYDEWLTYPLKGLGIITAITFILYIISVAVPDNNKLSSEKSLKADIIICTLFGYLGIHRFYEKKKKSAIIWLVVFFVPKIITGVFSLFRYAEDLSMTVENEELADFLSNIEGPQLPDVVFQLLCFFFIIIELCILILWFVDLASMLSFNRTDGNGNYIIRWNKKEAVDMNTPSTIISVQDMVPETKIPKFLNKINPSIMVYGALTIIFIVGSLSFFL